jgi:hypothetical protein
MKKVRQQGAGYYLVSVMHKGRAPTILLKEYHNSQIDER